MFILVIDKSRDTYETSAVKFGVAFSPNRKFPLGTIFLHLNHLR